MTQLTQNFSLEEFAVSGSHPDLVVPVPPQYLPHVRLLAESCLQPIRNLWSQPMKVLSGYRSPELNEAVNGSPTSQHMKAEAADIQTDRIRDFYAMLFREDPRFPAGQVIGYPSRGFVHIATPSLQYPSPAFFLCLSPKMYTRVSSTGSLNSLWPQ